MSNELMSNDEFATGIAVGIQLHQFRMLEAHRRREPIKIADELFYLQSSRERLQEFLEKICK